VAQSHSGTAHSEQLQTEGTSLGSGAIHQTNNFIKIGRRSTGSEPAHLSQGLGGRGGGVGKTGNVLFGEGTKSQGVILAFYSDFYPRQSRKLERKTPAVQT